MRVELVYMQYNKSDSQALFWCSVLIVLEMASLDTLFLCSAGQQVWLCSYLVFKVFTKTKTFVLIKLFLWKKCNGFSLSRDHSKARPTGQVYGWQLLYVIQHPAKFGGHAHCGSGDIMVLFCHVTWEIWCP